MKLAALSFLGFSVLVQSIDPYVVEDALELQEPSEDERETGALCDFVVRGLKNTLESKLPFTFDCSCTFRVLRPIDYSCSSRVCFDDIMELIDVDMPLPITEESCLNPVASGQLMKRTGDMTTKVCSGATSIVINITQIEEATEMEIYDEPTFEFEIPDSCLEVEHNVDSLATYTDCSVIIAGQNCGCTPCEGGTGVQVDCIELIEANVPEILHPVLNYTEVCIYPGLYDKIPQAGQKAEGTLALGLFGYMVSMNV